MANNIRGTHVSPGIYARETDITYAVKSLGITTLGVVGETLKGPAFQPMLVENWRDFQNLFGGTSAEKFSGSNYPKYELPYIAKSYLTESNQLQVCRVLGLSGYNAGPAWAITASKGGNSEKTVIAVLRSRGHYEKYYKYPKANEGDACACPNEAYDKLVFDVGQVKKENCNDIQQFNKDAVELGDYTTFGEEGTLCTEYTESSGNTAWFGVNSLNFGKFTIKVYKGECPTSGEVITHNYSYAVSFNPTDKDYILKVLGTTPFDGTAPLYVETLYDVALQDGIINGDFTEIDKVLQFYQPYNINEYCTLNPVTDILTLDEGALTRKHVGTRWLAENSEHTAYLFDYNTQEVKTKTVDGKTVMVTASIEVGKIYTVRQITDENGKRKYCYACYDKDSLSGITSEKEYLMALDEIGENIKLPKSGETSATTNHSVVVKNNYDNRYYRLGSHPTQLEENIIQPVLCDLNNYKDAYRYASTPWFVSNIKGDYNHLELTKLFRFHTISDGDVANNEVKVSIQNIKPNAGTFDVVVRDINDSDESVIILEKYSNCTLTPGDSAYIAYKIGSFDGIYETKSKYITVEVNESLATQESIPCGFLGYPLVRYDATPVSGNSISVKCPEIAYRVNYDQDVKNRRQYFGLSNSIGVDVDMFKYKGQMAYGEEPEFLSNGFHLDSRLENPEKRTITVDGISGYTFKCVGLNERTNTYPERPIIGTEAEMQGSIYENVDLRKFTAYFYGGFDGWDIYRESRTNTDEFKMNNYQGDFNKGNGEGYSFDRIVGGEALGINQPGITSDWYAYLAGIRQFANPEAIDINVFATPGIDIINNTSLVEEVIDMIEEERADSIYVVTTPDKPFGADDYIDEMYTPSDVVEELEDRMIDSNYTCTYYPWVKYHDKENSKYIFLPPTKDVVRNMAMTDNTSHPWFAPAGITRGDVNCVRAKLVTKLADEDVLYEGRINPVKTFASDGVKIWGQKNLQVKESQLNRIAVRRLLLRLRKLISISCINLIFDQNDVTIKNKFLSTVTPILDNIKSNRGISDYRIEVDDSPEARDRRELPVKLYFKPYQALEYITLDFIVTPESVSFDDI